MLLFITGGTLVSRCLESQNHWFVKGISWKRHNSVIIVYKLTLEEWMLHRTISKIIDRLIHGFLYHFNVKRFTVHRKRSLVVLMVRFEKNH